MDSRKRCRTGLREELVAGARAWPPLGPQEESTCARSRKIRVLGEENLLSLELVIPLPRRGRWLEQQSQRDSHPKQKKEGVWGFPQKGKWMLSWYKQQMSWVVTNRHLLKLKKTKTTHHV